MKQLASTYRKKQTLLPYLLILPTAIFVALFTAWPTLLSFYQSFFLQRLNIAKFREPSFIGFGNYTTVFTDPRFQRVISNTLIYILGTVPLSIILAFFFALLVNRQVKGIGIARLAFFHTTILPMVSAATVWMFFFTPDYGLFNTALTAIGYQGPQNWTGSPDLALLAVMIVAVWKNAGYYMIFYLAGLQNLPLDLFEAAALDGANWWQSLWSLTLPLLRRTTLFVITTAFIGAFQTVDHIFVLTKGGPSQASTVLLFNIWQKRFEQQDIGVSSALTVILIILLLAFSITNFRMSESKGDDYVQ